MIAKLLQVALRFGPLVAGAALGLAAVIEPLFPGYTGVVTSVLSAIGLVGVEADKEVSELVISLATGVVLLIGVARKLYSVVVGKVKPAQPTA